VAEWNICVGKEFCRKSWSILASCMYVFLVLHLLLLLLLFYFIFIENILLKYIVCLCKIAWMYSVFRVPDHHLQIVFPDSYVGICDVCLFTRLYVPQMFVVLSGSVPYPSSRLCNLAWRASIYGRRCWPITFPVHTSCESY
jgi:hypothetical protein